MSAAEMRDTYGMLYGEQYKYTAAEGEMREAVERYLARKPRRLPCWSDPFYEHVLRMHSIEAEDYGFAVYHQVISTWPVYEKPTFWGSLKGWLWS